MDYKEIIDNLKVSSVIELMKKLGADRYKDEDGQIIFEGKDLLRLEEDKFTQIRGKKISMIFQDPLSSLNPIVRVGKQITEAILINSNKLKIMYDNLISEELTNYKNVIAKRAINIQREKDLFGIDDFNIDEYIRKIDKELDTYIKQVTAAQDKIVGYYNITSWSQFDVVLNKNSIVTGTPEEMLVYLKEFAKTIVPELKSDPDIVVKEMDEASAKGWGVTGWMIHFPGEWQYGDLVQLLPGSPCTFQPQLKYFQ